MAKQKTIVVLVAIIIAGGLVYFTVGKKVFTKKVNQIKIDNQTGTSVSAEPANTGDLVGIVAGDAVVAQLALPL